MKYFIWTSILKKKTRRKGHIQSIRKPIWFNKILIPEQTYKSTMGPT